MFDHNNIYILEECVIKHSKQSLIPIRMESKDELEQEQILIWFKKYEGRIIMLLLSIMIVIAVVYMITFYKNINLLQTDPCSLCLKNSQTILNYYKGGN